MAWQGIRIIKRDFDIILKITISILSLKPVACSKFLANKVVARVSSVELSVIFSVEKMSVEKNMTLNSTINHTKFFLKNNVLPKY